MLSVEPDDPISDSHCSAMKNSELVNPRDVVRYQETSACAHGG
jgi:hypothetical protein